MSTKTEWHPIIVWGGLATFTHQYICKGSLLYLEGQLRRRQFEEKEGHKKYVIEIIANQIVLLDKKAKAGQGVSSNNEDELPAF